MPQPLARRSTDHAAAAPRPARTLWTQEGSGARVLSTWALMACIMPNDANNQMIQMTILQLAIIHEAVSIYVERILHLVLLELQTFEVFYIARNEGFDPQRHWVS
jgi:hypothetical protein